MGKLFRYIADNALQPYTYSNCWVCDRENVTAYEYYGSWLRGESVKEKIDAVCADCLRRNRFKWTNESELPQIIRESNELLSKLRQTPQIPMMVQYNDWAVCCDDLCEFIGSPASEKDLLEISETAIYWEKDVGSQGRNFTKFGLPESLDEISLFKCLVCQQRYWIDQFTLFWVNAPSACCGLKAYNR